MSCGRFLLLANPADVKRARDVVEEARRQRERGRESVLVAGYFVRGPIWDVDEIIALPSLPVGELRFHVGRGIG